VTDGIIRARDFSAITGWAILLHFEHERPKQVLVFEVTFSKDRLAALNSMLNSDQFRRLLPEAVAIDLRPSGLDELTLAYPARMNG